MIPTNHQKGVDMGRKPEEFDALGEGTLCRIQGDYSTVTLYFSAGSIGIDIDVQTSANFGENLALTEQSAAEWRDNLDAWLRWRNPEKYARPAAPDHRRCPQHDRLFKMIERTPGGRRICPAGDVWRVAGGHLVPWGEEV